MRAIINGQAESFSFFDGHPALHVEGDVYGSEVNDSTLPISRMIVRMIVFVGFPVVGRRSLHLLVLCSVNPLFFLLREPTNHLDIANVSRLAIIMIYTDYPYRLVRNALVGRPATF